MKQISNYDAAIIGAGASGLAAALTIKKYKPGASVLLLEKKERAAKKLAATGNGRCNLSNEACENKDVVFGFFSENGIMLRKDESGRFYPCSEDAGQLASLLTEETVSAGVRIRLDSEVKKVEACPEGGFLLLVEEKVRNAPCMQRNCSSQPAVSLIRPWERRETVMSWQEGSDMELRLRHRGLPRYARR